MFFEIRRHQYTHGYRRYRGEKPVYRVCDITKKVSINKPKEQYQWAVSKKSKEAAVTVFIQIFIYL